jgi:hypothetical protein
MSNDSPDISFTLQGSLPSLWGGNLSNIATEFRFNRMLVPLHD